MNKKIIKNQIKPASDEAIHALLGTGVSEVIERGHLEKDLKNGAPLRVKLGADPSAPDLHLGHAVVLRKLKQFQDLGHTVVFIIGDYTARIGDPTGKSKTRPQLEAKTIAENAKTYFAQVGKILDVSRADVHFNSEWFGKMDLGEVINLLSNFTVARIIERDDFSKRLKSGADVSLHELLYPAMQAYDSVAVRASVEIGGTDQKFNMLAGRDLQRKMGLPEQDVITCPLLIGTDGTQKMSKSLGNYIGLLDKPEDMYGKVMSVPDNIILHYFELATHLSVSEIDKVRRELESGVNPRDVKMRLAREIVALYWGKDRAAAAEEHFRKVFQKGEMPENVRVVKVTRSVIASPEGARQSRSVIASPEGARQSRSVIARFPKGTGSFTEPSESGAAISLADALIISGLAKSKAEARRLVEQGGVKINGVVARDPFASLKVGKDGVLIQKGKREFVRIVR